MLVPLDAWLWVSPVVTLHFIQCLATGRHLVQRYLLVSYFVAVRHGWHRSTVTVSLLFVRDGANNLVLSFNSRVKWVQPAAFEAKFMKLLKYLVLRSQLLKRLRFHWLWHARQPFNISFIRTPGLQKLANRVIIVNSFTLLHQMTFDVGQGYCDIRKLWPLSRVRNTYICTWTLTHMGKRNTTLHP